jgi:hypothetical protein
MADSNPEDDMQRAVTFIASNLQPSGTVEDMRGGCRALADLVAPYATSHTAGSHHRARDEHDVAAIAAALAAAAVVPLLVARMRERSRDGGAFEAGCRAARSLAATPSHAIQIALLDAGIIPALVARADIDLKTSTAEYDAGLRIVAVLRDIAVPLAAALVTLAELTAPTHSAALTQLVQLGHTLLRRTAAGGPFHGAVTAVLDVFAALAASGAPAAARAALDAGAVALAAAAYLVAHEQSLSATDGWELRRALEVVAAVGEALTERAEEPHPPSPNFDGLNIHTTHFTASRREFVAGALLEGLEAGGGKGTRAASVVVCALNDVKLRDHAAAALLALRVLHVLVTQCDVPLVCVYLCSSASVVPAGGHPSEACAVVTGMTVER